MVGQASLALQQTAGVNLLEVNINYPYPDSLGGSCRANNRVIMRSKEVVEICSASEGQSSPPVLPVVHFFLH